MFQQLFFSRMKSVVFAVSLILVLANSATGQRARGYSEAGPLGVVMKGPDVTAPKIVITKPTEISTRGAGKTRGLSIVPEETGELVVIGRIEDDREIQSLMINGHTIKLRGKNKARKNFGLKVKAPEAGKLLRLKMVAVDAAGNKINETFEVSSAVFETVRDSRSSATIASLGPNAPDDAQYWALVIAVGDYQHPSISDLDYPVADAHEVANALSEAYTFEKDRVKILENPDRSQLIKALSEYAPSGVNPLSSADNLLVFYAGHGYFDEDYREGYWLPSDAEKGNRANWVSNSDVQRAFRGIGARHILLLSDACFSGSLFASRNPFTVAVEEAYKEKSRKAITAGNFTEVPDRSVFKEYLVKRLLENETRYFDAGALYLSLIHI